MLTTGTMGLDGGAITTLLLGAYFQERQFVNDKYEEEEAKQAALTV
jgi:hypothetical protein